MNNKISITRKSRVGFGYRIGNRNNINGGYIDPPDRPGFTGTIKTVSKCIDNDAMLRTLILKNARPNQSWFILNNGKWVRVVEDHANHITDLLLTDNGEYRCNSIILEYE